MRVGQGTWDEDRKEKKEKRRRVVSLKWSFCTGPAQKRRQDPTTSTNNSNEFGEAAWSELSYPEAPTLES